MEEKGRIPGVAEVSVAGPLSTWNPIKRKWDRAYWSLIKNSSELKLCTNSKQDPIIELKEGFELKKLNLTKDNKHVFSLATIPSKGIRTLFIFGANNDNERNVWLEKIQDSCSMQCNGMASKQAGIESKPEGDSLPRTVTYISNDSGFSQETANSDKEPTENCQEDDSQQYNTRYTEGSVIPMTRMRCDDLSRSESAITCPYCQNRFNLIAQVQKQGSTKVAKEDDIRTGCLKATENDESKNEQVKRKNESLD